MKVLVIKLNSLGDVVMALPMLGAIREIDEGARITWVCADTVAPLLKELSSIDELLVVDEGKLLGKRGVLLAACELAKVCLRLAGRRYDLVVTGHRDYRYRLLSCTVRSDKRRSFSRNWPVPGRYHADEYIRLVTRAEGPDTKPARLPTLRLPLSESLDAALKGIRPPLIALAPGGATNALRDQPLKRWPLQRYAELAKRALGLGWGVAITGAPSDEWVREAFRALAIVDLVGKTGIKDLVGLYNRCDAVVTHDSGPMHLAALAGAPLVGLFGPTDPAWFAPRQKDVKILWGGSELPCRPCYDGKNYARCGENVCLQQISVNMVVNALNELIGTPCAHATTTRAPVTAVMRR